ncbi:LytTR family DNA-binding domain-containing protein [Paenibacillus sp. L3-i20]|uniref:LytTR family DNA-binding domain-containing protein n=1 Tax=Paenibacillus sp. L3-i20 TaxID=2905833 RepID=UPI001EDF879A|nr:LytTR family DNA-binding domain-containing protein [Paenibacillus sp. L3-i20]GKU79826.1 hypothetical protein L3i20_v242230 [Paenibacillus sp. L3-i20]
MIALTHDERGTKGLIVQNIQDIDYIKAYKLKKGVKFYIKDRVLFMPGTLTYWCDVLNNSGYNFRECDRSAIANLDNIIKIDFFYYKVYFESGNTIILSRKKREWLIEEYSKRALLLN